MKSGSRIEFLGMLGSFGTLLCGVLLATLERDELSLTGFNAAATCSWRALLYVCLKCTLLQVFARRRRSAIQLVHTYI